MANKEQGGDLIGTLKGLLPYCIDVIGFGKERGRVEATIGVNGCHSESHRVAVICITHDWKESRESKALIESGGGVGRCC